MPVDASATQIGELEAAVVALDESLHLGLRPRKLLRGGAQTLDTFLEKRERMRELYLLALELVHDGVETLETLLEGQSSRG